MVIHIFLSLFDSSNSNFTKALKRKYGLGAKLIYIGYFASLLHPQEEKLGYYFQLGTGLGALETHVLLSFLWSAFCKRPVINITLLTLKIVVLKLQD